MRRPISWLLSSIAIVVPAAWATYAIRADEAAQKAAGAEHLCGNPMFAIMILALLAASVVSVIALAINLWSLRTEGRRGALRYTEIFIMSTPMVVAALFFAWLPG